jgi:phosphoglycerate kinase
MKLRNLKEIDITGKTILYRAPYDIEVVEKDGVLEVSDSLRIEATLPTLQYLLNNNCKIVILFYVGRPDGQIMEKFKTNPHARKLSELLGKPVEKVDDCLGTIVEEKIAQMKSGDILMLENVRFYKEELEDTDVFAEKLCQGKDLIVFDGFPQAHRKHASTTGILRHLPSVAGFYFEEEVKKLSGLLENPKKPFTVIIGGVKISDKVEALNNLLKIADTVLLGGAVANVFLKAEGRDLGSSLLEDSFGDKVKGEKKDWIGEAKAILWQAETLGKKVICPSDLVISDGILTKVINVKEEIIPMNWSALDLGPETIKLFSKIIEESKTVFISGPVGKFGDERFAEGSKAIIRALKNVGGETIIAGGDTIDVFRKYGNLKDYSHLSLAGGATLEFLAGKELPVLKMLQ